MQGYEQKKEECSDARGVNWLENIARDVRYGVRMLRRSPVFTAVAILSFGARYRREFCHLQRHRYIEN
jgi:hypothetical protein